MFHMVLNAFAQRNQKLFCRFFFDLDAQNNNSSISEAASPIKGRRLGATASTSHMLDSSVHRAPAGLFHHMQDGTQDRLNVSVQLASSSDAERIFSVMNDISHGRSGGTCLRFRPPFALHLPVPRFLLSILLCLDHAAGTNC